VIGGPPGIAVRLQLCSLLALTSSRAVLLPSSILGSMFLHTCRCETASLSQYTGHLLGRLDPCVVYSLVQTLWTLRCLHLVEFQVVGTEEVKKNLFSLFHSWRCSFGPLSESHDAASLEATSGFSLLSYLDIRRLKDVSNRKEI